MHRFIKTCTNCIFLLNLPLSEGVTLKKNNMSLYLFITVILLLSLLLIEMLQLLNITLFILILGSLSSTVKNAGEILKSAIRKKYKKQREEEIDTELCAQKEEKEELVQPDYKDMFNVRTVLTTGMAGVGKTFQTKMFMIKWAKKKTNKNIDIIVSFQFSELNKRRDQVQSMEELLNNYFSDIKLRGHLSYDKFKILFILDGLEECTLPLDFINNKNLTDMKAQATMDELLTNLVKGTLLPSAHLWIISQPSGVDKIPSDYIQKVTKCQGKRQHTGFHI